MRGQGQAAGRTSRVMAALTGLAMAAGCSTLGAQDPTGGPSTTANPSASQGTPTPSPMQAALAQPDQKLLKSERAVLTTGGLKVTSLVGHHEMPGLAYGLEIVRTQVLRQHAWDGGGQLTVTPTLVASSSKLVGVSITAAGKGGTRRAVVYYDPQTNVSYSSTALIAPEKWAAFADAVAQKTGDRSTQAATALAKPTWPQGSGPAIGFSGEGHLVVQFQGADVPAVVLPGDQAKAMLSELGVRARAAAQFPTPASTPDTFLPPSPALVGASQGAKDPRPPLTLGTDCARAKCVVLTFDDGPVPQTQDVLDTLKEHKVPATFFVLGQSVDLYPEMVTKTAANGMEVASHNQVHNQMSLMGPDLMHRQITMSRKNIRRLAGTDPLFLRPPYGAHNKRVDQAVGKNGMAVALWSVDTLDWKYSQYAAGDAQAQILSTVTQQAGNGGVVLMHDIHANSRQATAAVIKHLKANGYTIVSLAELSPSGYRFGRAFCASPSVQKECGI